jgi:hypothetical protein
MNPCGYSSQIIIRQREHRAEKRKEAAVLPIDILSDSDDFDANITSYQYSIQTDGSLRSSAFNNSNLLDYKPDEHDNVGEGTTDQDDSPALFSNSSRTVSAAAMSIIRFATNANLDIMKNKIFIHFIFRFFVTCLLLQFLKKKKEFFSRVI